MLSKTFKVLNRTEEFLSSTLMLGMVVIITVQVFCRYVLQSSLDWSEEIARYIFIWAVYLGASYALHKDRHLEITILRYYLPARLQRLLILFAYACVLFFCLYMTWFGGVMVLDTREADLHTPALDVPAFWFWTCIPVSFALMAVRVTLKLRHLYLHPDAALPPIYC